MITKKNLYNLIDKKIEIELKDGTIKYGILDDITTKDDSPYEKENIDIITKDNEIECILLDEIKRIN